MPRRPPVAILLPVVAALASAISATARDDNPRIDWQPGTIRLIHPGALYGRIRMLPDGVWLCCLEKDGQSWTKRSRDRGASWEPPVLMGAFAGGGAANPELCVLGNGQVLGLYNERPREENGPHPYTIRLCHSPDGGRSWTRSPEPLFTAGRTRRSACWEPAAIQDAEGTVHLFISHELPGEQEILAMRSSDHGKTWSTPRQASLRPGHRDGMPVPAILADKRLVFAIEDNGLAGPGRAFRPTIVDAATRDRWPALANPPGGAGPIAAPYLVRLPSGATLLSAQASRGASDPPRMAVYVGDPQARSFTHRSHPFGSDGPAARWNSLFVIDDHAVLALASTRLNGQQGLWSVTGKVVRARADRPGQR